jgi:hypothetical protein
MPDPFRIMCTRYAGILEDADHDPMAGSKRLSHTNLSWMLAQVAINCQTWPLDKTGCWLGFVQGCLAMQGLIDVDAERDWSRPILHDYYVSTGIRIPDTLENI